MYESSLFNRGTYLEYMNLQLNMQVVETHAGIIVL